MNKINNLSIVSTICLICFFTSAHISAQTDIHSNNEGGLSTVIGSNSNTITNMKLTARLNAADITFLRQMMGRDASRNSSSGKLSILDMSSSIIVTDNINSYYMGNSTNLNQIGEFMFAYCDKIKQLTLRYKITSIGYHAFAWCTNLDSISIPSECSLIGDGAFYSCQKLSNIYIPNKITAIGDYAFYHTALSTISLPESVTSIGSYAFADCKSLQRIDVWSTIPPTIGTNLFGSDGIGNIKIYVHGVSSQIYKKATGWSDFANNIFDASSTAIVGFSAENETFKEGNAYDICGRKVSSNGIEGLAKGIYIIKGKKIIVNK